MIMIIIKNIYTHIIIRIFYAVKGLGRKRLNKYIYLSSNTIEFSRHKDVVSDLSRVCCPRTSLNTEQDHFEITWIPYNETSGLVRHSLWRTQLLWIAIIKDSFCFAVSMLFNYVNYKITESWPRLRSTLVLYNIIIWDRVLMLCLFVKVFYNFRENNIVKLNNNFCVTLTIYVYY